MSKTRRKANVTAIFKEESGNYRPVDLTFITRKVMEMLILETVFRHVKDKKKSAVVNVDSQRQVMLD